MEYMEWDDIEKYNIGTDDINKPIRALGGYNYWHCPRCKVVLGTENGHVVYRCQACNQAIDWTSKTSNLDKMLRFKEKSELCGEFLDWFLQKYAVFERRRKRESPYENVMGAGDYINKEKLLAEFFDIDLEEAEREKESLLRIIKC